MRKLPGLTGLLVCLLAATFSGNIALGQLNYDESVDGELSDDLGAPTELVLGSGINTIFGTVGDTGSGATNGSDADYFFFTLAAGQTVDSITTTRSGVTSQSFVGYVAGNAFTGQMSADIDANALFSDGESLLPGELLSNSLSEGSHAFWVQETAGPADYGFSFNVVTTTIPEPSSFLAILAVGCSGLLRRKRR